jgi:hypothetical protein
MFRHQTINRFIILDNNSANILKNNLT